MSGANLDELCINTIRFLAVDAVEQARSGHPGAPMGAAPAAYVLWDSFLKHNPLDPRWPDRDRFILSAGHASALLYSLLHLTGYDISLDDLKQFRQFGSKTPGHPEYAPDSGIEVTTGPLGQGFAHGVGMAIAERWLANRYNRPGHEIIDHYTYALVSDGDLQEGVAAEAASLAGTLGLNKLIYFYDDNGISIEGDTDIAFLENVGQRFSAYGWQVIGPVDGNDLAGVAAAVRQAREEADHPSLIICQTVIGFGSPNKAGTGGVHGEPLGSEEAQLSKETLGWTYPDPFTIPEEAGSHLRQARQRGKALQDDWNRRLEEYRRAYPEDAGRLEEDLTGDLPEGWDRELDTLFSGGASSLSTRDAGGLVMNAISRTVPTLLGGSADLAPSTKTLLLDRGHFGPADYSGHNFHFGVREHAMGAVANGMALHGGVIPFTATFLIFSDYMRPAIRLGALMGQRVVYVFTHDSVALGQDGPTHQPIEQLLGLRAIPNLEIIRPADATETAEAWKVALNRRNGPHRLGLEPSESPCPGPFRAGPRFGSAARRLRALARRPVSGCYRHGIRLRGSHCPGRCQDAPGRRHRGPRRLHACLGSVRLPARRLSEQRPSPGGQGAGVHRSLLPHGMGAVRRSGRDGYRRPPLRGIGARGRHLRRIRPDRRAGGPGSQAAAGLMDEFPRPRTSPRASTIL